MQDNQAVVLLALIILVFMYKVLRKFKHFVEARNTTKPIVPQPLDARLEVQRQVLHDVEQQKRESKAKQEFDRQTREHKTRIQRKVDELLAHRADYSKYLIPAYQRTKKPAPGLNVWIDGFPRAETPVFLLAPENLQTDSNVGPVYEDLWVCY